MSQRPLRPSALPPGGLVRDPPKAYRALPTCRGQAGDLEWPGGGCVKLSAVPCLEGQRCSVPDGCGHSGIWAQSGQILQFSRKAGISRSLCEITQF